MYRSPSNLRKHYQELHKGFDFQNMIAIEEKREAMKKQNRNRKKEEQSRRKRELDLTIHVPKECLVPDHLYRTAPPASPQEGGGQDGEFEVEEILDLRVGEGGEPVYYVKWVEEEAWEGTWERKDALVGCEELVARVEEEHREWLERSGGRAEVEAVVGVRRNRRGEERYQVRWRHWRHATWETSITDVLAMFPQ